MYVQCDWSESKNKKVKIEKFFDTILIRCLAFQYYIMMSSNINESSYNVKMRGGDKRTKAVINY